MFTPNDATQKELYDYLLSLLTTRWEEANKDVQALEKTLLELGGYASREEFIGKVAPHVAVISIVGGVSSRWDTSFDDPEGAKIAEQYHLQRGQSRFLAQLPNLLPPGTSTKPTVPVLEYNLRSVLPLLVSKEGKPLGTHVLIYGKEEDTPQIEKITAELHLTQTHIVQQRVHPGKQKPSGHADALLQHQDLFRNSTYVITHFGGDVISFRTVLCSLLLLDVIRTYTQDIGAIIPTARMDEPPYPIFIDEYGLPRRFGHAKLFGNTSLHQTQEEKELRMGGSNVSIRVYDTKELVEALTALEPQFAETEEFALDHVDTYFAQHEEVRQFAIARPEEITGAAKTLQKIPIFLKNTQVILEENT